MRFRPWALVVLAVAGAQGGHVLAYELRFGPASAQLQATGAHAYFPPLVKMAVGLTALALIGALLLIAVARVVAARGRPVRGSGGPSFVSVLAVLFTLQLSWFIAQEVVEALVAGVAPAGAATLILWGMAGQLPVAAAGAAVACWLGRRVQAALADLGDVVLTDVRIPLATPLALRPAPVEAALAVAHAARSRTVKRGPPSASTFRSY